MLQHTALCPHGSECLNVRGSRSWSPVEYQRSCGGSCKYATIRSSRGTTEIHVNLLQLSSKHIHAFQEACDTYRGVFPRVQRTIIIAITVRRGGGYRRRESGAGIYRTAPTRLNECDRAGGNTSHSGAAHPQAAAVCVRRTTTHDYIPLTLFTSHVTMR